MSKLEIYVDYLSQPCRALCIFLKMNNIPFIEHNVSFISCENRLVENMKVNPLGTVPFINDDGFWLCESVAIFRYLSGKFNLFRQDMKENALIDKALEWYHTNIRFPVVGIVFYEVVSKLLNQPITYFIAPCNKPLDSPLSVNNHKNIIEYSEALLRKSLNLIENNWLEKTNTYLVSSSVSIADILWCCELEQLNMLPAEHPLKLSNILVLYPNINIWMQNVKKATTPYYEKYHECLTK